MFYNSVKIKNINAHQLHEKMRSGSDFFLLDVRTPAEHAAEAISGSYLIPVQELQYRLQELPKTREIVVYCHVGNRSAYACALLVREGFNAINLEGGIRLWNTSGIASFTKAS